MNNLKALLFLISYFSMPLVLSNTHNTFPYIAIFVTFWIEYDTSHISDVISFALGLLKWV